MGLHSSAGRALQRKRRGDRFESLRSPEKLFFRATSQLPAELLQLRFNCDGHILISFVFPQFRSFHSVFRFPRQHFFSVILKLSMAKQKNLKPEFIVFYFHEPTDSPSTDGHNVQPEWSFQTNWNSTSLPGIQCQLRTCIRESPEYQTVETGTKHFCFLSQFSKHSQHIPFFLDTRDF